MIDLAGLQFDAGGGSAGVAGTYAVYHPATRRLTVHSGTVTDTLTLMSPAGTHFEALKDAHGGTEVTLFHA